MDQYAQVFLGRVNDSSLIQVFEDGWEPDDIETRYDHVDGCYLPVDKWWDPIIQVYEDYVRLKAKEEKLGLGEYGL